MNHDILRSFIDGQMAMRRAGLLAKSGQLTLGEIMLKCEAIPDSGQFVVFDNDLGCPGRFSSWRGIYAELAIEPDTDGEISLSKFLKMVRAAIGETFEGYKGGEYQMSRQTPVWVAHYGESGNTQVVDVKEEPGRIVIVTCEGDAYD